MPAGLAVTGNCPVPLGANGTLAGVTLIQENPAPARIATGPAALFFTVTFAVALFLAALVSVTTEGVGATGAAPQWSPPHCAGHGAGRTRGPRPPGVCRGPRRAFAARPRRLRASRARGPPAIAIARRSGPAVARGAEISGVCLAPRPRK